MTRIQYRLRATGLGLLLVLLVGCGVRPTGVTDEGDAPTGIAPGVTLYFVDAQHHLQPQVRQTGRLGTISEALALLLGGPGGSPLHTEIAATDVPRIIVTTVPGLIELRTPFTVDDLTPRGIDQLVCTALAVNIQGGGERDLKVQVGFTLSTPESDKRRTCPLINPAR